jgi:nicotinamide mononucleotide (NMN) deamidase PncC
MSFPPADFEPLLTQIAANLTKNKQKISIAETAAGGLISASLLSVAGASAYFAGGATLYTLPSRKAYAGWTQADLDKYKYSLARDTNVVGQRRKLSLDLRRM